jgi:general secretion pathway protein G
MSSQLRTNGRPKRSPVRSGLYRDCGDTANRRRRCEKRESSGFTLIEILVVIVVIAVLATLVAPNVFRHVGSAKEATARSQIEMLGAALDAYRLDVGRYPTSEQGLDALWEAPTREPLPRSWRGPYLKKALPPDPWGNPYVYRSPGEHSRGGYDLVSYGADGRAGGEDENADIRSWE